MRWKEGEHNPIPMISFILYLDSPFSSINSVCALLPPEICGRREGWEGGKEGRKGWEGRRGRMRGSVCGLGGGGLGEGGGGGGGTFSHTPTFT